jgi:uridine kinase
MNAYLHQLTTLLANKTSVVVTISGPSGSGKSSVAKDVMRHFADEAPILLSTDDYYIGKSRMQTDMPRGEELNFDHPASIDLKRLKNDVLALKNNKSIDSPIYDMFISEPTNELRHIEPSPLIVIEGIAASLPILREIADFSIRVTAPFATRLERCIKRDIHRNGRTEAAVREHFLRYVEPSYEKYYAATDRRANHTVKSSR